MAVKVKKSVKKTVPAKSTTTTPPIVVKAKVKVKIGGGVKDLKKGK
jgi:hypothetical protein